MESKFEKHLTSDTQTQTMVRVVKALIKEGMALEKALEYVRYAHGLTTADVTTILKHI